MKARTTANIELLSYEILIYACKLRKTTISKLISLLLGEIIVKYNSNNTKFTFGTTKYQSKNISFKQIHFTLPIEIYESGLDLRKFNKLSLSLLINEGIKRILGDVLSNKNTLPNSSETLNGIFSLLDNYVIRYHIFSNYNNKTCFFSLRIRIHHTLKEDLTIPDI